MLPATLTSLLIPLRNFFPYNTPPAATPSQPRLQFELRHLHAVSESAHVIFSDVQPRTHYNVLQPDNNTYTLNTRPITSFRPPSFNAHSNARRRSMKFGQSETLRWEEEEIISPDVESRETLLELAKMTNNAYVELDDPYWYDLGGGWNSVRHYTTNAITSQPIAAPYSHIRLDGNQTQMDFVDMYSQPQTTRQLYCQSKVPLQGSLAEVDQRSRRTSSTIICSSVVAVLALTGRGLLSADAIVPGGNATRSV
jgi:hypothetical protein